MVRSGQFSFVVMAAFAAALCGPLRAQTADDGALPAGAKVRLVPPAVLPMPFSTATPKHKHPLSIEFVPADKMSESDRLIAADAESSIAEHAHFNGFDLEDGRWSYQQIVCPALPNHLFLQYTQNRGVGDVTVFSASIPRDGGGRVRIVPILKRSYSLFSPAPINALTISAFNHIRAEEPQERSSNWLGNGLCYAALAGAHPRVESPDLEEDAHNGQAAMGAVLVVPPKGGEVIKFADADASPHPMEWTMTFTYRGKLIKATHTRAPLIATRPVPSTSANLKTWTVPN